LFLRSRIHRRTASRGRRHGVALYALAAVAAAALLVPATSLAAGSGGVATPGSDAPTGDAKLVDGKAIAPVDAPTRVVNAIEAANEIVKGKGYCLGGGHGKWRSKCYDCSGSVSYALHGARMLDSALPSGSLAKWGQKGKGDWITVYANGGHAYAVIAGLRLDTSMTEGAGPGWSDDMRSSKGYKKRHFKDGF
jgi:hypothetical protein